MTSRFDDEDEDPTELPAPITRKGPIPSLDDSSSDDEESQQAPKLNPPQGKPTSSSSESDEKLPANPRKGGKSPPAKKPNTKDDESDFDSDSSDEHDLLESSAYATAVAKSIQTPIQNFEDDDDVTTEGAKPLDIGHPIPPNLLDSDYSDDSDKNVNNNNKKGETNEGNPEIEVNEESVLKVFSKLNKTYAKGDDPLWELEIDSIPNVSNKKVITELRKNNAALQLLKRIREQDH